MTKTQGWILVGLAVISVALWGIAVLGGNGNRTHHSVNGMPQPIESSDLAQSFGPLPEISILQLIAEGGNRLTSSLTPVQFEQNLNAIINTGTSTAVLEGYISNYQRDSSGDFVLIEK